MEYFLVGILVGMFIGTGLSGLALWTYRMVQLQERATDVSVEEIDQWIEDEHVSEMDVTIPLIVKEEPKPSAVGDAEVRRRSDVVNEANDQSV